MGMFSKLKNAIRRRRLTGRDPVDIFAEYAATNKWGDKDSLSGRGSNLETTAHLRSLLPDLLRDLEAASLLDVPCGDFFWMRHVDLAGVAYTGGDIVPELVARNAATFARKGVNFAVIDLLAGPIPKADVIFVRDCLVHLSNDHVRQALSNIAASGGTWLLTTTFPDTGTNADIATGEWRPIDLTRPPFNLPPPHRLLAEGQVHLKGQQPDKMLGLWRISDIAGVRA